ncbi:hypothetical protein GQ42DRAFT_160469 [Ramicandelaber brevisporus]|nr:hypothetical protein GQ42DRAFT_160469 [Ramicandelaber brevisporus]
MDQLKCTTFSPKTKAKCRIGCGDPDCKNDPYHFQIGSQWIVGLDLKTGEPMDPTVEGVWDNACVVKHQLTSAAELARNLLLVDSIVKAGRSLKQ